MSGSRLHAQDFGSEVIQVGWQRQCRWIVVMEVKGSFKAHRLVRIAAESRPAEWLSWPLQRRIPSDPIRNTAQGFSFTVVLGEYTSERPNPNYCYLDQPQL